MVKILLTTFSYISIYAHYVRSSFRILILWYNDIRYLTSIEDNMEKLIYGFNPRLFGLIKLDFNFYWKFTQVESHSSVISYMQSSESNRFILDGSHMSTHQCDADMAYLITVPQETTIFVGVYCKRIYVWSPNHVTGERYHTWMDD